LICFTFPDFEYLFNFICYFTHHVLTFVQIAAITFYLIITAKGNERKNHFVYAGSTLVTGIQITNTAIQSHNQ